MNIQLKKILQVKTLVSLTLMKSSQMNITVKKRGKKIKHNRYVTLNASNIF